MKRKPKGWRLLRSSPALPPLKVNEVLQSLGFPQHTLLSMSRELTDIDWQLVLFWFLVCFYLFIYLFAFRRMTVWVYSLFSHYASVMFPAHTSSFMAVAWGIPLQSRQYDSGEFLRLSFGFVFSNSYKKEFLFFLSLSQFNFDLNTLQVQWLRLLKYISAKTKK